MSETRIPEALALLREKGWCRDELHDNEGRHCIMGAGFKVHGVDEKMAIPLECIRDEHAIVRVIEAQYDHCSMVTFNDDPATTFADVEFVLEKAILERGGAL